MKKSELETEVYNLLKNSNLRVFKEDTRDPNYRGEYIEILPLEFGEERLFNSSIVNVNIHIPDVQGIKNSKRLDSAYNEIRWKSHATLTLLATQDCPLWLQYD